MNERCLFLVRHGETVGESSVRYHGRNDVPLSAAGRQQVLRLVPDVRQLRFAAVTHSPLARARESAQILVEALRCPPAVVEEAPDLAEVDFGAMEGLTEAEVAAALPEWFSAWKRGAATGFPGGETFAGFAARAGQAIDGVLARHPHGDLMVVAHKGIIKRIVGRLLRMSDESAARLNPELGSLTVLATGADAAVAWRLKHWSMTNDAT